MNLAIVVVAAALLGVIAKIFKQPIVLAYLLTGILIGFFGLTRIGDEETFKIFSDLGIMFLLFLVGLEINYTSLKTIGKSALLMGVGQILATSGLGFAIAKGFGFSGIQASYIGAAMAFASTVIVVKLLSEKKDLNSLYGKLTIGLLLVQDFVAILILVILAGIRDGGTFSAWMIVSTLLKGVFLFFVMVWLGRRVLPRVLDRVANAHELLFVISLAWLFLVAAVVSRIGFSVEIGGFLAGLAMANASEHFQIAHRVRPLRDFFILVFFVILGSSIAFSNFSGMILPIIAFSLFVLIGNPLIILIIMSLMGYKKRTGFLAGVSMGQMSEFSLILATLGLRVGHLNGSVVSMITAVGIITITISSYLITHAESIFRKVADPLSFFERKKTREESSFEGEFDKEIILIGAHRTGQSIAASLPKEKLLVVEFDPEIIGWLRHQKIDYIFGDIIDSEVFDRAHFEKAKLVVSTNPSFEDNLTLLSEMHLLDRKPKVILRAENEAEAEELYRNGADYVLLPHITSGQYLGKTIAIDPEMKMLEQLKGRDLDMIKRHKNYLANAPYFGVEEGI